MVDDQQLVASTLTYSLRDNGLDAHYLVVTDLEAVQTAALAYLPGIVLLDLDLGAGADGEPLDGVDLIVPLRAQGWTVLVITRHHRPGPDRRSRGARGRQLGGQGGQLSRAVRHRGGADRTAGGICRRPNGPRSSIGTKGCWPLIGRTPSDSRRCHPGSGKCSAASPRARPPRHRRGDPHVDPHGADPHPSDPDQAGGQLSAGGNGHRGAPSQPGPAHQAECLAADAWNPGRCRLAGALVPACGSPCPSARVRVSMPYCP